MICGLAALITVSAACAGERYVEIWNPPEARGAAGGHHDQPSRKGSNHEKADGRMAHRHSPRRVVVHAPFSAAPVRAASQASRPTFDDIPRQLTPEGNVLRVDGRTMRAKVER
ncbi:hypothetical protein G3O01_16010 [Burkholderia sp. Ac-20365]|nr:hypothetical protein [Burkholderia sp. Ac-20365]